THVRVEVGEGLGRPLRPDAGLLLDAAPEVVVGEGEHPAVGVVDQHDLLGPEQPLRDRERADDVGRDAPAGVADHVGVPPPPGQAGVRPPPGLRRPAGTIGVRMTTHEIRGRFLEYFERRDHLVLRSASLVPYEDDPSVLLTIAGMQPLKSYFLGRAAPPAPRMTSCQKCMRTADIEEVGRTAR